MKANSPLRSLATILLAWNFACAFVLATDKTDSQRAYEAVQSGILEFQTGNLDTASKKFEEAISLSTDDTIIRFDQACVDLANGQQDSAREKLRQAVAGSDPEVVQSAHYNLGFLKVQQAKAKLQPDPAAVAKKVRTDVADQLEQAARHFRNTLEINSNHEDAAYNLELIRMYLKQLNTMWKQQDEQQQQPEESLPKLLLRLQPSFQNSEQRMFILRDEPESASRQTAITEFQVVLRDANTDVEKVRPLFDQWVQSAMQSRNAQNPSQQSNQPSAEEAEAIKALTAIVSELETSSEDTVAAIATQDWTQGQQAANECIQSIHQLLLNVASYQETLQAALSAQSKLNSETNGPLVNQIKSRVQRQQFISDFSQALKLQAEQQLPQIQQQLQQRDQTPATSQTPPQALSKAAVPPASVLQADEQKAMLEGLQESMSRAIQLAPDAVRYANQAAGIIPTETDPQNATADVAEGQVESLSWAQGKVLSLLQDIAEPLQDPNSDQQQPENQNGENSEDDQQQPEDQNSDQQDPNDESSESDQQQPEESQGEDSQDSDDQQQDEEGEPKPLPAMAQRQAEAILRKAAEREQEYREMKRRQQKLQTGKAVKKDW